MFIQFGLIAIRELEAKGHIRYLLDTSVYPNNRPIGIKFENKPLEKRQRRVFDLTEKE